jgi:hypothetical protein
MASKATLQKRFDKLSEICLALPGVTREDESRHSTFRVAKKVFAYHLNDHDGDRIVSVCCKALEGDNARLMRNDPARFYLPPYIGARGWVGFRLDLATINWSEVKDLLLTSYRQTLPAKFLKLL